MKRKLYNLLLKHVDFILYIVSIFLLCTMQLMIIGNAFTDKLVLTNTLDFSWQIDSIERLLHGYIAGRDFIFTYGPVYQFIVSLPSVLWHLPSYYSVLYANLFLTCVVCLLLIVIVRAIGKTKKEQITLFLLSIILFLQYPSTSDLVRILIPFFYTALYFKYNLQFKKYSWKQILVLILPAFFGLYSFDLFLLCFLLSVIFEGIKVIYLKQKLLLIIIPLSIICITEFCLSILLTQNLNYLIYSLDTVKNYQFIMNIPWSLNKSFLLIIFPIVLLVITYFYLKKKSSDINKRLLFLFFSITAFVSLKAAFIRSDEGHILMAIYPSILVLLFYFKSILKVKLFVLFLFTIVISFITYSYNYLPILHLNNLFAAFQEPQKNHTFFDTYALGKNSYTETDLKVLSKYITSNPGNVMVYPYDSFLLSIFGETLNTLPLQYYQYSNSAVEKASIERLERKPPQFIILGIDGKSTVALDSIPNFTRNPILTKWLLENYIVDTNDLNYLILSYNPNKSKASYISKQCQVYEISSDLAKTNIFDSFGKPATLYLEGERRIRLPYSPNSKSFLLVENGSNSESLKMIFNRPYDFSKPGRKVKKRVILVKQYVIPGLKTVLTKDIPVICY